MKFVTLYMSTPPQSLRIRSILLNTRDDTADPAYRTIFARDDLKNLYRDLQRSHECLMLQQNLGLMIGCPHWTNGCPH